MKKGTIVIPNDAPPWLSNVISNLIDYTMAQNTGPQVLTGYSSTNLPNAANYRKSIIYNNDTNVPRFANVSGSWTDLVASSSALTALLALTIVAGTWTPTLTNTANISSSTPLQCQYMRVGSVVSFSGGVTLTPTLLATLTTLGISLPVASNFSAAQNLGGSADSAAVASASAAMFADTVNDRATFQMVSVGTGAETFYFSGSYLVI